MSNLNLKIVLDLMDKVTSPLKALGKTVDKLKAQQQALEQAQNKVAGFKHLTEKLRQQTQQITKATEKLKAQKGVLSELEELEIKRSAKLKSIKQLMRHTTNHQAFKKLADSLIKAQTQYESTRRKISKTRNAIKQQESALKALRYTKALNLIKNRNLSRSLKRLGYDTKNLSQLETILKIKLEKTNALLKQRQKIFKFLEKQQNNFSKGYAKLKKSITPIEGLAVASGFAYTAGARTLSAIKQSGQFLGGIIQSAAAFEKIESVLKTVEGSSEKARKSLKWVSDFAAKTPYNLDTVSESFVRLRAYGLDPTNGLLETLGDTASAMGKDVMQAVEAIADAVTGENERLKEFGIKASTNKNIITYTYTDKQGKQKTATAHKNNRKEIEKTLTAIWNEKYAGAMKEQSKTLNGMLSNLSDQWTRFQLLIMQNGAFDFLKEKLGFILDNLNKMAENGELKKWAAEIGQSLLDIGRGLWDLGKQLLSTFKFILKLTRENKGFLAGFTKWAIIIGAVLTALSPLILALSVLIPLIGTITGLLLANPIGLVITAIGALVGGIVWLYHKFDWVRNGIKRLWNGLVYYITHPIDAIIDFLANFTPLSILKHGFMALFSWLGVDAGDKMKQGGVSMMKALLDGLLEIFPKIGEFFTGLISKAKDTWNSVKSFFGFGDDDDKATVLKETRTLAQPIAQHVPKAITYAPQAYAPKFTVDKRPPLRQPTPSQTVNAPLNATININAQGMSHAELQNAVRNALDQAQQTQQAKARASLYDHY